MVKRSLRWLGLVVLVLFLVDESLPLLNPWRGTLQQWFAVCIVLVFSLLVLITLVNALLKVVLTFAFWRVGSGDIERGRRILDARVAARAARRKAT